MMPHTEPKKRTTWKRLLLGLIGIAALIAGFRYWKVHQYEQELATLLAQINAEDPNWTWEQMQAARPVLDPKEDAGIELVELLKLTTLRETIPSTSRSEWARKYYGIFDKDAVLYSSSFLEEHPNARLPTSFRVLMEPIMGMEPMPAVLSRARGLRHFDSGRIAHAYRQLLILSLLPDVQGTRTISNLLAWDADLPAHSGHSTTAIESIQGMLGVARCLSHDPFLITLLVRTAIVNEASRQTARLLALPLTFTSDQLKSLQADFEREQALSQGYLTVMMRSERAVQDHDLALVAEDKVSFSEIANSMGIRLKWTTGYAPLDQKLVDLFPEMLFGWGNRPGHRKFERIALLKFYTEAVRWSALPEPELLPTLDRWKTSGPFLTPFLRRFQMVQAGNPQDKVPELRELSRFASAYLKNRAELRAVIGIIAAERFRLDHGRWPASWEQLIPEYVKQVPLDPFTGQAMLLKPLPDGLVIYSAGSDGKDDGGDVIRKEAPTKDIGFRLWNTAQRGINLDEKFDEEVKKMKQE